MCVSALRSVCVKEWRHLNTVFGGPRRRSVLASPRYRYHPPPLWHDGRKMIRGTGDNGGRDSCLYLGQRRCQVQQHYTQKERRGAPHKRALKHSRLLQECRMGVLRSQLTSSIHPPSITQVFAESFERSSFPLLLPASPLLAPFFFPIREKEDGEMAIKGGGREDRKQGLGGIPQRHLCATQTLM